MKPFTAILVEDEPKCSRLLSNMLLQHSNKIQLLATTATVAEGIDAVAKLRPGIVFLDMEMPDGSGFDVIDQAPVHVPCVVVVSAFDTYALPAIKHGVVDYLLKPVDGRELAAVINRVTALLPPVQDERPVPGLVREKLALPSFDGLLFVNMHDVMYCRSEGSYTRFFLAGKTEVLVSKNIGEYEALLPAATFCRVHNMYIVNMNCIKKYIRGRGGYILLQDDTMIEISVRRKDAFLARFGI